MTIWRIFIVTPSTTSARICKKQLSDCFADNRLDAIIFPTTILSAVRIGDDETVVLNGQSVPLFPTLVHNTAPGSIAGIPGVNLSRRRDRPRSACGAWNRRAVRQRPAFAGGRESLGDSFAADAAPA